MRELSNKLTIETLENMYLTELFYQEIYITRDSRLQFDLIHQAVEELIQEYGDTILTDPEHCILMMRNHMVEIVTQYPNYFVTGELEPLE